MKIAIINKSDSTGGTAVVSRRLMDAFRAEGVDAQMIVAEKLTDSPFIHLAASPISIKKSFIEERLKIFAATSFRRKNLFKIDTASDGLPLWRHPIVREADAIILNWVNQGVLSLKGVQKILQLGKPVIWTMHDMWTMTGVCHHAGECLKFRENCGHCPLLSPLDFSRDLSRSTWIRKRNLNGLQNKIRYVAVSTWLSGRAAQSSLLSGESVTVIPNAFPLSHSPIPPRDGKRKKIIIIYGAARLDDPIKNLPALIAMTRTLKQDYPALAERMQLMTFGVAKNSDALEGIAIPVRHLGRINGEDAIRRVYEEGDILVSPSHYETLPGTLVEAQAYGCIPVSFDQGGQRDIISHLSTGYIAPYISDTEEAGRRLAKGVEWAASMIRPTDKYRDLLIKMRQSVETKFSPKSVAQAYLRLIEESGRGNFPTGH